MLVPLVLAGYVLGSIPFAWLLARRAAGVDVRFVGSGNVGAANVFRVSGRSLGLAVATLDIAKGCAAVLLAVRMGGDEFARSAVAAAAVTGHVYPCWLRFRGGKGVATAAGAFGVVAPLATGLAAVAFAATLWLTRYVSLASVVAGALLPLVALALGSSPAVAVAALGAAGLIIFRHRGNLARLRLGTERRLGDRG